MSRKPYISVVMPVYNAENFLHKAMDSVLGQTLVNVEVIAVDDGSTDKSASILKDYALHDTRVRIISQSNAGYGAAMNAGLNMAQGEYIGIVEPDDYIDAGMYADLYKMARRCSADIVKSNYFEHSAGKDTYFEVLDGLPYGLPLSAWDDDFILLRRPCIWSAIYKQEMLNENHIRFNETPGASYQDTAFAFKALICAESIVCVKNAYLHYRLDNDASSVNDGAKVFAVRDELAAMDAFLASSVDRYKRFSKILNVLRLDTYWWNYHRIGDEKMKEEFRRLAQSEFSKAEYDGFLDLEYFDDDRKQMLAVFTLNR